MISRRKFLLGTAAASAAAATGAAYIARPYLASELHPELDTSYPVGILDDRNMRAIAALGESLVAAKHAPPTDFFRDFVNDATRNQPGLLKEYRRAAGLLDVSSAAMFRGQGSTLFADLSRVRRDQVLRSLLWRYSAADRVVRKVEKLLASHNVLAFRIYVMEPMIVYYYRSSYGWAVVGYDSFPGRPPSDPRAYTKPPIRKNAT